MLMCHVRHPCMNSSFIPQSCHSQPNKNHWFLQILFKRFHPFYKIRCAAFKSSLWDRTMIFHPAVLIRRFCLPIGLENSLCQNDFMTYCDCIWLRTCYISRWISCFWRFVEHECASIFRAKYDHQHEKRLSGIVIGQCRWSNRLW